MYYIKASHINQAINTIKELTANDRKTAECSNAQVVAIKSQCDSNGQSFAIPTRVYKVPE